jgi:hypothetical protein
MDICGIPVVGDERLPEDVIVRLEETEPYPCKRVELVKTATRPQVRVSEVFRWIDRRPGGRS